MQRRRRRASREELPNVTVPAAARSPGRGCRFTPCVLVLEEPRDRCAVPSCSSSTQLVEEVDRLAGHDAHVDPPVDSDTSSARARGSGSGDQAPPPSDALIASQNPDLVAGATCRHIYTSGLSTTVEQPRRTLRRGCDAAFSVGAASDRGSPQSCSCARCCSCSPALHQWSVERGLPYMPVVERLTPNCDTVPGVPLLSARSP